MTLERPLWLLALIALPVLVLLARNLRQRRTVPVSSLLIFRRLCLPPDPPRELARRADRLLLLRLLAAGAVAFGLAGPILAPGDPEPVIDVLIDNSPSMGACRDGVAAALDRVAEDAPPGTELRVTHSPVDPGLRALLADPDGGDVVVVTDHAPVGLDRRGRVRLFLVGVPVENVGITAAWLEAGRYGAVVENFGTSRREVTVRHPGGTTAVSLEPGGSRVIEGAAAVDPLSISLAPGDRFDFDDRIVLALTPAVAVSLAWSGPEEPSLRLALESAGVVLVPDASGLVAYRTTPGEQARLVVAPPGPRRTVDSGSVAAFGGMPAEACPPPGLPLGAATVLDAEGRVLLADRVGPLAFFDRPVVTVALDPGDPESRWSRDPSFPVFMCEVARRLGVRDAGFEVIEGVIDPVESATRPVSAETDLTDLAPGRVAPPVPGFGLAGMLFGVAGALLLLHFLLEARRDHGDFS